MFGDQGPMTDEQIQQKLIERGTDPRITFQRGFIDMDDHWVLNHKPYDSLEQAEEALRELRKRK